MKLNDIYESNSNWLKADDIKGSKPIVTIESAEVKENTYNGETKKQIVLKFAGKEKQLGLNFTNAARIAELTGTEDFDEWVGTSLKLYVERVKFQDKMVDAIRIFPELPGVPSPKHAGAALAEPMRPHDPNEEAPDATIGSDSDIPF